MSATFTKLDSGLTESTLWSEPDRTRLVWITMLARCDQFGRVLASIPGLAHIARVPIKDTEAALDAFLSPDPYSRTKEFGGRRIEAIDGGWRLLNHGKYRALRAEDDRREQNRLAQARARERRRAAKASAIPLTPADASSESATSAHTEADADAEKRLPRRPTVVAPPTRKRAAPRTGFGKLIVDLYNEKLAAIDSPLRPKRADVLSASRKRRIDAFRSIALSRARQLADLYPAEMADDVVLADYTARYFDAAAADDFIAGRTARGNGHEKWRADLDYVLTEKCFTKVVEQ